MPPRNQVMVKKEDYQVLYDSDRFHSWSRLRNELFQSELIAPTDVDPKDIQFSRRLTIYRSMLILMIFSVAVIAVESFAFNTLSLSLGIVSGIVSALLVTTFVRLVRYHTILLPPIVALAVNLVIVLWAVNTGAEHHTLWLFPLMIAMAGLLPTGVALSGGLVTLVALLWVQGLSKGADDLAEHTALIATWLISLSVMRMMARQSDELADLALTDPLTGAYNRRYLLPQAQRNLADFQRYARLSAILMIDIDHFKVINDEYGHAEGDRVLKALTKLIDDRIRGVDMLFRLGGEEFVVLLSEVGSQSAQKIGDELRKAIAKLNLIPGKTITVSVGVCDVTQVDSAEDWLQQVDEAMYSAKKQGRDRVCAVENHRNPSTLITETLPIWR